jgi:enoyl-CoA hydratase/carnithine racemase
MSTDPVLFEIDDEGVALITLNRPDKLNAMGGRMLTLLDEYYQRCDEDDAVRAVVVTGAGRAFCSGADMSDAARTFDVSSSGGFDDFSAAALDFPAFRIRKLVVAAVNGHAIGLGMTLALHIGRWFAWSGSRGRRRSC